MLMFTYEMSNKSQELCNSIYKLSDFSPISVQFFKIMAIISVLKIAAL
jgi:hypothetical protein